MGRRLSWLHLLRLDKAPKKLQLKKPFLDPPEIESPCTILDLPTELILMILSHLKGADAMALKLANRHFYRMIFVKLAWTSPDHIELMRRFMRSESGWFFQNSEPAFPCYFCRKFLNYSHFTISDNITIYALEGVNHTALRSSDLLVRFFGCLECLQKTGKFFRGQSVIVSKKHKRNDSEWPCRLWYCPGCNELKVRKVAKCCHCQDCYDDFKKFRGLNCGVVGCQDLNCGVIKCKACCDYITMVERNSIETQRQKLLEMCRFERLRLPANSRR